MKKVLFTQALWLLLFFSGYAQQHSADVLARNFMSPPDQAKPRVYWFWIYNRVTKAGIERDLAEFKKKGISGVNLICNGGYAGERPLPGVKFLGKEWCELFRFAVREANRLHIEIGFNMAGGWTMMGPSVTKDQAMKKVVWSEQPITGPMRFSATLPQPVVIENYYHDIYVQAFRAPGSDGFVDPKSVIDITGRMDKNGRLTWQVPPGKWVILRTGYTLTGHPWSKWKAYPEGDTFEGGAGYEIDYLSRAALDDYFSHLGLFVIKQAKLAGGHLDYLWSDSWECGKLNWTQDFRTQFQKFRHYDLKNWMPALAGYTLVNRNISARFLADIDRTVQDCIAENFYGHFAELCKKYGLKVGNEAGGPNDIPPQDVLKNFSTSDILAGEFWVNGTRNAPGGYNKDRRERLNLKQTATAAHVYGKKQAEAEAFTEQERDGTHWTLGPSDLKPYTNDAFCEGINRLMLHAATCQPPDDGKPGYEYCAGQHFTPNVTWWDQSQAFFSYLSRCQYMLQQGKFVADVCFYLGEQPPLLAPPKYQIPGLGAGYDCDYINPDVLLHRLTVKNGCIALPDGMSYKLLVLQNCVSPVAGIAHEVGAYQQLKVPDTASNAMSLPEITKLKALILAGATVIGAPPANAAELGNYTESDLQVRKIAREIWGHLDGKSRTSRPFGKGRIIWGQTPLEVLQHENIIRDFSHDGQSDDFDYIHRKSGNTDIYFVINRTNQWQQRDFGFRITGKQPEFWDPVTGQTHAAQNFKYQDGYTKVDLNLAPFASYFIVFRKPGKSNDKLANFAALNDIQTLSGPWSVSFDTAWGGPALTTFDNLTSWTERPEDGIKYYSGAATYTKAFEIKDNEQHEHYYIDFGDIKNVAEVSLNGKDLGILWCAPWRLDVTAYLQPGINQLKVKVVNLWANRVVHDLSLPKSERLTKTHDKFRFDMLNVNTPILPSGLLGPVTIAGSD